MKATLLPKSMLVGLLAASGVVATLGLAETNPPATAGEPLRSWTLEDCLARALEKISEYKEPMQGANSATAHLYISNPFGASGKFMAKLFSTHPPIEERIKSLRSMA